MMPAHARDPSYWWDRFIASDPALVRLKMGLRAMLGLSLGLAAIAGLGTLLHQSISVALVGVMMGMMGAINVQDPHPREQRVTLLWAIPISIAAVGVAALSAPSLVVSAIVFLGVIFLAIAAQRFGPRGVGLGMIGFMLFFLSLFFHAPVAQLPWVLASVAVGGCVAYAVRFWLVRDRPEASVRRAFASFRRSLALLMVDIGEVLDVPDEQRRLALLRRAARQVNEAALAVEKEIENADPEKLIHGFRQAELREYLLELELTAERIVFGIYRVLEAGPLSPEKRQSLVAELSVLRRQLRDTGAARAQPVPPWGANSDGSAAASTEPAFTALEGSLSYLRELIFRTPSQSRAAAPVSTEAAPVLELEAPASVGSAAPLHPSTRQAIQATVAGALAILAGHAVSSTRWFWAVIASFVIFNRATTRGDILLRAWHRILGTVIGVLAGIFLATVVRGHRDLEFLLIFVCVFLGFYLIQVSYAWMVFWFTALLAVLYSLLGLYSPELLYLRVWETLVGAGIGAVVAVVLLPARTGVGVKRAATEALLSVASFLEAAATLPGGEVLKRVREMDGKLREVRDAARPLTDRLLLSDRQALRLVHALGTLAFFVKQLAPACVRLPAGEERIRRLEMLLAENARSVAASFSVAGAPMPDALDAALQSVRESLAQAREGEARGLPRVLHWLERIDAALLEVYASRGVFLARRKLA
ncbi:FUSC family protein [Hyalangium minutum]|uniref:Integral membrane bound transporter domain-containing protein n=1 Tax=Hyalangium minutum TaxID=394096 RepID=A0A085WND8_9BACT|nr:FUSC family protein [Hyalangium minutum]KFE69201.1 hypothetical protein DB31_7103 [Hyalangium minutum]